MSFLPRFITTGYARLNYPHCFSSASGSYWSYYSFSMYYAYFMSYTQQHQQYSTAKGSLNPNIASREHFKE